jgi:hypothetical protein
LLEAHSAVQGPTADTLSAPKKIDDQDSIWWLRHVFGSDAVDSFFEGQSAWVVQCDIGNKADATLDSRTYCT